MVMAEKGEIDKSMRLGKRAGFRNGKYLKNLKLISLGINFLIKKI